MPHSVFLGYNSIFGEEAFSNDDFLKKIPLKVAVSICSYIGSRLYMRQEKIEIQLEIFNFFIRRQPRDIRIYLRITVEKYLRGGDQIFLSLYLNVFLKYCLDNCDDFEYDDSDIGNDLLILKAYVNRADNFNSSFSISSQAENQHDYFRINNWPIYLGQVHHNMELNPLTTLFKGILLLDFFKRSEEWRNMYMKYLDYYKVSSHTHLLQILMKFIMEAVTNKDKFFIKTDEFGVNFFSNFEFLIDEYRERNDKDLYILANPLFRENDNSFYVLNYNYLANKLYHGVIFDFFNRSTYPNKKFSDFKSIIGGAFIEKHLFRRAVSTIFVQKFYNVYFDDLASKGFPDAVVIRKNKVFIFEVKDALLASSSIQSKEYKKIKKEIDKFFVNGKGVTQIAKFLNNVKIGEVPFVGYHDLKLSKLEIIPIIIYTDSSFDLPGIGDYLNREFQALISKTLRFKKINEVLFIHIDFLIEHLDVLQAGSASFEKSIGKIYSLMRKRKRQYEKYKSMKNLEAYHQLFDQYYYSVNKVDEKRKLYVKFVFEELGIKNSYKETRKD